MKKITAFLFAILVLFGIGCQPKTIIETENQRYYITELVGDPNGRNVLRATTVWSEDAVFEILMPDYWEVKIDTEDKYNTDIYVSSNEYENDTCVMLPGTVGYGVSSGLEKEQWMTLTQWGSADDWYFYETVDGVRRPVFRTATFTDPDGKYYIFEVQYPEENWEGCNSDFSDMIATFKTLDTELEDTYIGEYIFQPKGIRISLPLVESPENQFVIDYPSEGWSVEDSEEGYDILVDNELGCSVYSGVPMRDFSEAATYEEDVIVLDNNEMAKKYTLYTDFGARYMEIISIEHEGLTYNFELHSLTYELGSDEIPFANEEACLMNFESIVQSFRTYAEEIAATSGYDIFDEENQETSGTSTVSE